MKKATILFSLGTLVMFASCKKEPGNCDLVEARVLRYDCDRVIFQLMESPGMGDSSWTDVQTGLSYNNVVYYRNSCRIPELSGGEKISLYVKAEQYENPVQNECYECQAVSQDPPHIQVEFLEVSLTPCPDSTVVE